MMRKHLFLVGLLVFTSLVFIIGCYKKADNSVRYEALHGDDKEVDMSEAALALGITAKNYPYIDGSTSQRICQ